MSAKPDDQGGISPAVKDGGPAFPSEIEDVYVSDQQATPIKFKRRVAGMSLRDYFAAKAIEGKADGQGVSKPWVEEYARSAYQIADAMLKAREVKAHA